MTILIILISHPFTVLCLSSSLWSSLKGSSYDNTPLIASTVFIVSYTRTHFSNCLCKLFYQWHHGTDLSCSTQRHPKSTKDRSLSYYKGSAEASLHSPSISCWWCRLQHFQSRHLNNIRNWSNTEFQHYRYNSKTVSVYITFLLNHKGREVSL